MLNTKQKPFPRVPYGLSIHGEEEIKAVLKVLNASTQMGKNVRKFENEIAKLFAKQFGIMVNSGSSALQLALEILGLPAGFEVITPVLTFGTVVAAIVKNQLVPVFIDVKANTFCIDESKNESVISSKTKAMLIPNLLGNVPDLEAISSICNKYNLKLIEDSADTLGAKLNGQSTGTYSDISITSFYGSHIINCAGNGGMLCVDSAELAKEAKLLRSWGRSSSIYEDSENVANRFNIELEGIEYDKKFVFERIGYNYEPSELGAAFGLVQLKNISQNISAREKNFKTHFEFFSSYPEYFRLPNQLPNVETAWLAFPIVVKEDAPFSRKELQIFLEERNIQTRVIFTGNVLRQPGFKNITAVKSKEGYPEADRIMKGGLLIGCHQGLNSTQLNHLYESFNLFLGQFK